jgi:steroid 5-alpha reductase family enzyme
VADQQQWRFQESKRAAREAKRPHANFLTSGLFRYSRHPNFFAEQALWWCFYLFSVAATGEWLNVTIVGPTLLTLLFHGSTNFTESISLSKYPEYADYQRRVSRLVPWPAETTGSETAEAASGER